eukprot:g6094.t1
MSSRQRRLFERTGTDVLVPLEDIEVTKALSEEETETLTTYSNPYGLLDQQPEHSTSTEEDTNEEIISQQEKPTVSENSTKKKRRSRGRRRKKNPQPTADDQEEDLDTLLSKLELTNDKEVTPELVNEIKAVDILQLNMKTLRGDEELNRIFGASVVANVEAELEKKRRKEQGVRERSHTRTPHRFLRRFVLVTPHPDWEAPISTLTMDFKGNLTHFTLMGGQCIPGSTDDGELFEFVGLSRYVEDHKRFLAVRDMGDPNLLANFANLHPYHVESLIAMYDFLMSTGQSLHAEECLKRALFILELSWHKNFSPFTGKCRIDYKVETNRMLFDALFRHVQQLSKRGCVRTSFECCKFLLSLDKSDPLGALCMIDYLALRAGEYNFILELINELEDGPSLALRPGIVYSMALAEFRLKEEVTERLTHAILIHPMVIVRLVGKLKDKGVRFGSEWDAILTNKFFSKADDGGSASLNHLVNLFVERHHMLYKPPEVLEWLKEGCKKALAAKEGGTLIQGAAAEDWECVRVNFFPPDDRNEYKNLHLYDFSDEVNQLPEDVMQMGGGLEDVEARMAEALERHRGVDGVIRLRDEDLRQANPLLIFLQSLLPWVQRETGNEHN